MNDKQLIEELEEDIEALETELTRLRELLDRVKALVIDDMPQGQTGYADAVNALERLLA